MSVSLQCHHVTHCFLCRRSVLDPEGEKASVEGAEASTGKMEEEEEEEEEQKEEEQQEEEGCSDSESQGSQSPGRFSLR